MTRIGDFFLRLSISGASASILLETTDLINVVEQVRVLLSAAASLVAIIAGIISIILKIVAACKDGKITDEELADIKNSTNKVIDDAKEQAPTYEELMNKYRKK